MSEHDPMAHDPMAHDPMAHDPGADDPTGPGTRSLHPHEVHDLVGGWPAFEALVEAFYARVERDEVLRPAYPEDLEPGKRRLALFLAQYWGGGDVYSRHYGHPRLRMRHASFDVTPERAERWAQLMSEAIREQGFPEEAEALLLAYVEAATPTMINRFPEVPDGLPVHPG